MQAGSLRKQIAAGFLIPILGLLLLGGLVYRYTKPLKVTRQWLRHTYEVRAELAALLSALVDAETGERGFVLTGLEESLQPYRVAIGAIPQRLERMRTLTADNPAQQQRVAALSPRIVSKRDEMMHVVAVRRLEGMEAARQLLVAGETQQSMRAIREQIEEMDALEAQLLSERDGANVRAAVALVNSLLVGTAVLVLSALLIALFFWRRLDQLIHAMSQQTRALARDTRESARLHKGGADRLDGWSETLGTVSSHVKSTAELIAQSARVLSEIAVQMSAGAQEHMADGDTDPRVALLLEQTARTAQASLSIELNTSELARIVGKLDACATEIGRSTRDFESMSRGSLQTEAALRELLAQIRTLANQKQAKLSAAQSSTEVTPVVVKN